MNINCWRTISCRLGLSSTKNQTPEPPLNAFALGQTNGARPDRTCQVQKKAAHGRHPPLSPFAPKCPSHANSSPENFAEEGHNSTPCLELNADSTPRCSQAVAHSVLTSLTSSHCLIISSSSNQSITSPSSTSFSAWEQPNFVSSPTRLLPANPSARRHAQMH